MLNYFSQLWKKMRPRISPYLFAEIAQKVEGIECAKEKIEVLVLGSSHLAQGFNPAEYRSGRAFNLASTNQDLYTANHLLHLYAPQLPQFKEVIISYSVFSVGHELDKGRNSVLCTVLNHFYHIEYPAQSVEKYKRALRHRIRKYHHTLGGGGYVWLLTVIYLVIIMIRWMCMNASAIIYVRMVGRRIRPRYLWT